MLVRLNNLIAFFSTPDHLLQIAGCMALAVFLWFCVAGDQGLLEFHKLSSLKKGLITERASLEEKLDSLKEQEALIDNLDYLELVIREELGYVKPGEVVFQRMK